MPAYVVVQIAMHDPVTYEQYKALAPASIAAYGGRYLVRGGPSEVLEGARGSRRDLQSVRRSVNSRAHRNQYHGE